MMLRASATCDADLHGCHVGSRVAGYLSGPTGIVAALLGRVQGRAVQCSALPAPYGSRMFSHEAIVRGDKRSGYSVLAQ